MKLPIVSGIYSDEYAEFRTEYPLNLYPVPKSTGINESYMASTQGITQMSESSGAPRGGIWNERQQLHYRVLGGILYTIRSDGSQVEIGSIFGTNRCRFDYSFNTTCIVNDDTAYLTDGVTVSEIDDPDLGSVFDVIWIDGYYLFTDGEFIIQNELTDEGSVSVGRYGSSEIDPDPITGLGEHRNELVAFNRHSIETFENVGGTGFTFQRIETAMIPKGCVGPNAKVKYAQTYAFVGSGRNESVGVYLMSSEPVKISTREIDQELEGYTESELKRIKLDKYSSSANDFLIMTLPDDRRFVYDVKASQALGVQAWHERSWDADQPIIAYNKWWTARDGAIGVIEDTPLEWGEKVWRTLSTPCLYNSGKGFICNAAELVSVPGRVPDYETNPQIGIELSRDGVNWTQTKWRKLGKKGAYVNRIKLFRLGRIEQFMILRVRYFEDARLSFTHFQLEVEALYD